MMKFVLEDILVYWVSLAFVLTGILEHVRRLCYIFLWKGRSKDFHYHWVACSKLALPKDLGGWGLKHPMCF